MGELQNNPPQGNSGEYEGEAPFRSALDSTAILETAMDGFWLVDLPSQRIIEVNSAYCRMSGYSRAELIRMKVGQLEAIETPEETDAHFKEVKRLGVARFTSWHRRKDESVFPVEISVQYLEKTGQVFSFFRDITKRVQDEETLRNNEQTLRVLFETMSEGIALNEIVYGENGEMVDYRIVSVNQAFYRIADYLGTNVVGNVATKIYGMSPEFIKAFWKEHQEKKNDHLH